MADGDGDTIQILLDCVERGGNRRMRNKQPSICKVSNELRSNSPSSFDPRLVSIGPLHREDENVKELQVLKESYLHDLVQGLGSTPDEILKVCLQKVYDSIHKIKASYAGIENVSDNDLARMMVMDGCFILEFCHKLYKKIKNKNAVQVKNIARDLFLVENQIPFFVLQDLFDCTLQKNVSPHSLREIVYGVLAPHIHPFRNGFPREFAFANINPEHLLDCLHKFYQPLDARLPRGPQGAPMVIRSAAELDRSGVNFKAHQDKNYTMTMKFESSAFPCFHCCWGKPTLIMPTLKFFDETEKILRNFIAYEQCFAQDNYYFTSYAIAMDMLIDTEEDIGKLVESNVIINNLGSKKEAADMFNKLCKDVPFACYYEEEFKQLNEYYNGFWPKHIARLRRTYFNNPWSAIAVIAGIFLFILTIVQTIFTILAVV